VDQAEAVSRAALTTTPPLDSSLLAELGKAGGTLEATAAASGRPCLLGNTPTKLGIVPIPALHLAELAGSGPSSPAQTQGIGRTRSSSPEKDLEDQCHERESENRRLCRELELARRQARQAQAVPTYRPLEVPEGWPGKSGCTSTGTGHLLVEWQQARVKSGILGRRLELEKELSSKLEAEMRQLKPQEMHANVQATRPLAASTGELAKPPGGGRVSLGAGCAQARPHPPAVAARSPQPCGRPLRQARPEDQPPPASDAPKADATTPPFSPPLRRSRSHTGLSRSESGSPPRQQEQDEVDVAWYQVLHRLPQPPADWRLDKERPSVYRMSGFSKSILARVSIAGLQVRVGGAWIDAEAFLRRYGPFESDGDGHSSDPSPPPAAKRGSWGGGSSPMQGKSASRERLLAPTISWANRVSAHKPAERKAAAKGAAGNSAPRARLDGSGCADASSTGSPEDDTVAKERLGGPRPAATVQSKAADTENAAVLEAKKPRAGRASGSPRPARAPLVAGNYEPAAAWR